MYLTPPRDITYVPTTNVGSFSNLDHFDYNSANQDDACWILFRTGHYTPWQSPSTDTSDLVMTSMGYSHIEVQFLDRNCSSQVNRTSYADLNPEFSNDDSGRGLHSGDCSASDVMCVFTEPAEPQCRLSIRMSAAFLLTVCLVVKAVYMVVINVKGRRSKKTQCLTFGDVIVASSMDPDLVVRGECMVNAGEAYRRSTDHKCHKHCTAKTPSTSGDELGHCQKCSKHNETNKAADLPQPSIATKYKKSLISNLGSTALRQMIILSLCSAALLAVSLVLAFVFGLEANRFKYDCAYPNGDTSQPVSSNYTACVSHLSSHLARKFGSFGGFSSTATLGDLPIDRASSEVAAFAISNGAQLLYSLLYLLLVYNITLISMEYDWGNLEKGRGRLRCTLVRGKEFKQSYLLQLPKAILFPMMGFSSLMHWLLGQAISTKETIISDDQTPGQSWERSQYSVRRSFEPACETANSQKVIYGAYAIWLATILMVAMTGTCYWAFSYTREGFIPQMYGSIRVCCAATTELSDYTEKGIQWGDCEFIATQCPMPRWGC